MTRNIGCFQTRFISQTSYKRLLTVTMNTWCFQLNDVMDIPDITLTVFVPSKHKNVSCLFHYKLEYKNTCIFTHFQLKSSGLQPVALQLFLDYNSQYTLTGLKPAWEPHVRISVIDYTVYIWGMSNSKHQFGQIIKSQKIVGARTIKTFICQCLWPPLPGSMKTVSRHILRRRHREQ